MIVDDGRSEATRKLVMALAARANGGPAVHYLQPPPGTRGPAAARNAGWRSTQAPLIAFTDDDTVPDADWLRQARLAWREQDGKLVLAYDPRLAETLESAGNWALPRRFKISAPSARLRGCGSLPT